eukprot:TRINITY_DN172_c0_g1_i1.p3 TRINITY_DN172_c0_g1~~TRINITY_DN172_c0_g1_i1.p3  ORF type:complete len:56 (-),score=13.79 TRINITY_DN172_c0_g1_i1:97-264(-)
MGKDHCNTKRSMMFHEIQKGHEDHPTDGHQLKKVEAPKKEHCNTNTRTTLQTATS